MLTRFRPHGLIGPNSDELVAAGIIGIPERPTMQATGPVVLCRAGRWVFVSHDAGLILGQLPAVRLFSLVMPPAQPFVCVTATHDGRRCQALQSSPTWPHTSAGA